MVNHIVTSSLNTEGKRKSIAHPQLAWRAPMMSDEAANINKNNSMFSLRDLGSSLILRRPTSITRRCASMISNKTTKYNSLPLFSLPNMHEGIQINPLLLWRSLIHIQTSLGKYRYKILKKCTNYYLEYSFNIECLICYLKFV